MIITNLQIQNVKKIKAIEIKADQQGNLIIITGENDQGKSTIIDSIGWAIGGKETLLNVKQPIRKGTDLSKQKSEVRIEIGKFIITRYWTANNKTYLKVTTNDENKALYPSPQSLLDGLRGTISFDPIEFQMLSKTKAGRLEQQEILLSLCNFKRSPGRIDSEIEYIKSERLLINREHMKLNSIIKELPEPESNLPDKKIGLIDLVNLKDKAEAKNRENKEKRQKVIDFESLLSNKVSEASKIREQIIDLNKELDKIISEIEIDNKKLEVGIEKLEKLVDENTEKYLVKMTETETLNKQIDIRDNKAKIENEAGDLFIKAEGMTGQIKTLESEKITMLKNAKLPIQDLGFSDDGILYQNLPLAQASDSEQFRVALAIKMADNPELRVIASKHGGLFDKNKIKVLEEMCKGKDYQLWLERVDEKVLPAIVIENGKIKEESNE